MKSAPAHIVKTTKHPAGLGGWLTIVGFSLIITPIFYFASFPQFFEMLQPLNLQKLISPNTSMYPASVATWLISETAFHLSLLLVSCILLYLFFTKSPRFPLYLIGFLWFNAAYLTTELFCVSIIPMLSSLETNALGDVVTSIASAIVLSPYMLFSKRVRNTFTPAHFDEPIGSNL